MAVTINVMHGHDSIGAMEFRRDLEEQVSEFLGCRISLGTAFDSFKYVYCVLKHFLLPTPTHIKSLFSQYFINLREVRFARRGTLILWPSGT